MTSELPAPPLSGHGVAMLVFAGIVFALFIWDRIPIATICLGMLVALPLGFVLFPLHIAGDAVEPLRFYAGFAHPALIAICALMVVGQGLVVTGALEPAARLLASWVATRPRLALLAVLAGAALFSGLVNDTPLVVLLIPLIIAAAVRGKVAPARMLLPMNYAVLIGGMATTIGTSTNLIVVSLAAGLGVGPFSLFSFYPLVAFAALPALAYLWLVAPRLLANVEHPDEHLSTEAFDAELYVEPDSWLDGRQLREVFAAAGGALRLIEVRRKNRSLTRLPSLTLRAGDVLLVQDTATRLKEIEASLHAALHDTDLASLGNGGKSGTQASETKRSDDDKEVAVAKVDAEARHSPATATVAQMIVTPTSPLVGRTVRSERIAQRYGVLVVGLRPRDMHAGWQRGELPDRSVGAGDILLLQGDATAMQAAQRDGVGLLLDSRFTLPRQDKAWAALLTMSVVVALAATKILPISLAALAGVLFLLVSRCLSWQDVTQALSVKVVLLVSASLALGDALDLVGATGWLAQHLAAYSAGLSPGWVLALLMALMGLLTNFVSNNAAAAIGTPLGIELARSLGAPPEAFVLAVMFGCNLCYVTPMGYQTNLLVMNAGGYRFSDFVRVGSPLFVIMWAALSYGLVLRYQL
ncbi:MAG: SLC13 family permease [Rubrivivax sp.]